MLQRVVRQAGEAALECEITMATNSSQKDSILNQLGDKVHIVAEPERRNTFPAIALSTAYLAMEKKCSRSDTVVVMPCDPYTETEYFRTISRMAECVEKDVAELVLMGIKPVYPSEKYGYIVPGKKASGYMEVNRFTEKPDKTTAESLLSQGALWNGGVFAFKLGYLMDITEKYVKASSFDELKSRYSELPKISFDYEVAEKAKSVAVVPYSGLWEDLGTWNALSEVLSSSVMGNAVLGSKAYRVNIVNELQIPIVCDGISDAIIAASPDGILVSSKECSEGIKPYVEKLDGKPRYEETGWGHYTITATSEFKDGCKSLTKELCLNAGMSIGYRSHAYRDEIWIIKDGEGRTVLDGKVRKVGRGDVTHIKRGQRHALKADSRIKMVEIQTGEKLEDSDLTPYSWEWED